MQIAPWVFPLTEETASVPSRVRGKAQRRLHQLHQLGITPACAGKRSTLLCAPPRSRDHPRACGEKRVRGKVHLRHNANLSPEDHPRVCGEKSFNIGFCCIFQGSPPRVRGKEYAGELHRGQRGITPACAGKRTRIPGQRLPMWDHPRVCGEKAGFFAFCSTSAGSPPRVRGKAFTPGDSNCRVRITPACAGKSPYLQIQRRAAEDHPRVCGEKGVRDSR